MTGEYEWAEARLVRDHLPPNVDVIELGAGLGYVSCVIDEKLNDDRRQIAVEPNPLIIPWLGQTKRINNATYVIRELAYAYESDAVKLDQHQPFWTSTTSRRRGLEVPAAGLADICANEEISRFSLVMDIEGAEYEVLTSEMELLEDRCSLLVVEFHDDGPFASSYTAELEESSFEFVEGVESVSVYRNTRSV